MYLGPYALCILCVWGAAALDGALNGQVCTSVVMIGPVLRVLLLWLVSLQIQFNLECLFFRFTLHAKQYDEHMSR